MNWMEQCEVAANSLTQSKRQSILDIIRSGKSLGETLIAENVTLQAVCGVINQNIIAKETLLLKEISQ